MLSQLFAGDVLLDQIADDRARISRTQHADDPAVGKIQTALLIWDPGCLPSFGADGNYGNETAQAVVRFKRDELGVPPQSIVDDVGPETVKRLDQIALAAEGAEQLGFVAVAAPRATDGDLAAVRTTIEATGGAVLLGLGARAVVVGGGPATFDALNALVGTTLAGVVTPDSPEPPPGADEETVTLITAWLALAEPAYVVAQANPDRFGLPFVSLGDCVSEVDA